MDTPSLKKKRRPRRKKPVKKISKDSKGMVTVAGMAVTGKSTVEIPFTKQNNEVVSENTCTLNGSLKSEQALNGKVENDKAVSENTCTLNSSSNFEKELHGKVERGDISNIMAEKHLSEGAQGITSDKNEVQVTMKMDDQKNLIEGAQGVSSDNNDVQVMKVEDQMKNKASESTCKTHTASVSTPATASDLPDALKQQQQQQQQPPKRQNGSKKRRSRGKRKRKLTDTTNNGKENGDQLHTSTAESSEGSPTKKVKLLPNEGDFGQKNQDCDSAAVAKKKKKRKRRPKKKKPVKDSNTQMIDGVANTSQVPLNSQPAVGSSDQKPTKKRGRRNRKKKDNQTRGGDEKLSQVTANQPISEDDDSTQPKDKRKKVIDSKTEKSTTISIEDPKLSVAHMKRKDSIGEIWREGRQIGQLWQDTRVEVIKDPFTCCYMPSFLSDSTYLTCVKEELADLQMITKNNDLYKFRQTSDLRNVNSPYIAGLRHFLYGEFREWLKQVTGIPLNDKVDMGCSIYEYTDVLLCHDDELEGRRIAYILYLVPPWSQEDGGTLDLFTTDENGQPANIVRSLEPEWNAFAFFEVSPISFHQVSEVLSRHKVRLSINGWFHGPPIERPERHLTPPTPLLPGHVEEDEVYAWVNHIYLDQETQQQIRRKFRTESAIELDNFVTEDKYEELSKALKKVGLPWEEVGPANKQSSQILNTDSAPEVVRSCAELLKSEAMFLILSQLTGLRLHKLAPPDSDPDSDGENEAEPNPRLTLNIHRWGHGSYTLVRDDCVETTSALDAHLFVNVAESWSPKFGGSISYITKDEDEELLTVLPRANCLALVYRDAETLTFTKHINASVAKLGKAHSTYHTFSSVYYE